MNLALIIFAVLFAAAPIKATKTISPAAAGASSTALPADSKPAAVKEAPVLIDSRFSRKSAMPWEKTTEPVELISTSQTC